MPFFWRQVLHLFIQSCPVHTGPSLGCLSSSKIQELKANLSFTPQIPLFLSYLPHTTVSLGSHSCICPKQKAPCLRTGFLSTPCSVSTAPSESSHSLPRASGKPSSRLCRGLRAQICCLQHGEAAAPALQTQHCCPVFPLQQALAFTAEAAGSVGTSKLSAAPLLPHSAASPSELQHNF